MLALAGCGGGSSSNGYAKQPPNDVVRAAEQAAVAAKSVHITGNVVDNGTKLAIDLTLVHGQGGKGKMAERGLSFELVRIGERVFMRGSDAFWRQFAGEGAVALLHGKWLTGPVGNEQLADLASLFDAKSLFKSALRDHGRLANRGEQEYQGETAVELDDVSEGGALYIAAEGEPYPVAIVGGQSDGTISFTEWNEDVELTAPKGAIDIATLSK
jgi:hypothetical protein